MRQVCRHYSSTTLTVVSNEPRINPSVSITQIVVVVVVVFSCSLSMDIWCLFCLFLYDGMCVLVFAAAL